MKKWWFYYKCLVKSIKAIGASAATRTIDVSSQSERERERVEEVTKWESDPYFVQVGQEYIDSRLKTPLGSAQYSLVNTKMLSHYLLVNWINETRYSRRAIVQPPRVYSLEGVARRESDTRGGGLVRPPRGQIPKVQTIYSVVPTLTRRLITTHT